jgi:hypothetical protein
MKKFKKEKKIRGQITVFVIIAIAIVVLIGIILIITNKNNTGSDNSNDPNYNLINSCLKQTGEQALFYIGKTGGYYNIPETSTEYGDVYYFYDNKNIMPTKENVQNQIDLFVKDFGTDCSNNLQNNIISRGNVTAKTTIYDDKVQLEINYPITIEKSNKKISYENFNVEIPGRVGTVYNAAKEYMDLQVENPGGICISCINDLANKYDIKFITYNYDNETIIFNLYDNNTKINNESFYVYSFAAKYDLNASNVSL